MNNFETHNSTFPGEMGDNMPAIDIGSNIPVDIKIGSYSVCVLTSTGDVCCWGYNNVGQLGIGSTEHIGNDAAEMGENLQCIGWGGMVKLFFKKDEYDMEICY